jgi:nucleoid-associated protein YgaU
MTPIDAQLTVRSRCRARDVLNGLIALCVVAAVVTVPPLLAYATVQTFGYPSTRTFAPVGELTDTGLADVLIAVLLILWARFIVCFLVEAVAAIRNRGMSRRIPLITGIEQEAARRLVTAAFGVVTAIGALAISAPAPPQPAAVSTVAAAPADPTPAYDRPHNAAVDLRAVHVNNVADQARVMTAEQAPVPAVPDTAVPRSADRLKRYVVQPLHNRRYDSLWAIAERYLGDGRRWKEIYSLNKDRPQLDGRRLQFAQMIHPAWVLLLPADAEGLPDAPPVDASRPKRPGRVIVEHGDSLWAIADHWLGDGSKWPDIFELNRGRIQPDGTRLTDPDFILPGLSLRLPTVQPHPEDVLPPSPTPPKSPPPPAKPSPTSTPSPTSDAPTVPPNPGADEHSSPVTRPPAWVAAAAFLATGVIGLWTHRRRRRDASVQPGQRIPPPTPENLALHTGLRLADDPAGVDRLDAALRSLAANHLARRSRASDATGPIPQVIQRHPAGDIEVLLREPCPGPPKPWTAGPHDQVWTLPAGAALELAQELIAMPPPCPALVQLGTTDDATELYADLEALGVLAIGMPADEGQPPPTMANVRAIARAITATIATSPLAEWPTVRTLGFDPFGFADEDRVKAETDLGELVSHVDSDRGLVGHALADSGLGSTIALRAAEQDESWNPTVAVVACPTDSDAASDALRRLADMSGDGSRGVAAVIPATSAVDARWHLVMAPGDGEAPDANRWRLDPLGIIVAPIRLAADELRQLSDFLNEAEVPPVDSPAQPAEESNDARAAQLAEPDWRVMVRLLGKIDAVSPDGRALGIDDVGERTLQILAWLATHHHGTRAQLDSDIWPGGVSDGAVRNQFTSIRGILKELGGFEHGDWRPTQADLGLPDTVVTDIELIQARLAHAERHRDQPEVAIPTLEAAIKLARGLPARYSWLDAHLGSHLTVAPTSAAILLAEIHLEQREFDAVLQVTDRGLAITPAHPGLVALRMRAHAGARDWASMTAEYDAFMRVESADRRWNGEPDSELAHLYDELLVQRHT